MTSDFPNQCWQMQVVDDFSSKLGLPNTLETPESIDASHIQMARCADRSDESYRSIVGVIKQFLKNANLGTGIEARSCLLILIYLCFASH